MKRIVNKVSSHEQADRWDVEQHTSMTPRQRLEVARTLKGRAFPKDARDVRECHRSR